MKSLALYGAIVAGLFSLNGCGISKASSKTVDGRPTVLRYCFAATTEDPSATSHRLDLTKKYLERELHVRVDTVQTTSYSGVIEAFRANKIDAASISPFSYVIASQKVPIEAIVMRGSKDGKPGDYQGVIAVAGNSPIRSIDDVVKHSKELTISFVDPDSTSGFLVQSAFLQSKGLEPQRDFKRVVFALSHPASLLALKAGKVEVAATMKRLVDRYQDTGKLARGDVRVLWVSPDIPNQPVAVRKDLPQAFKEDIRRAFLEMPKKDPEVWANQSTAALPQSPDTIYVTANDAMFDGLRAMARSIKNLSLLDQ
jgi:phosphonate transport system substrate-binding protein